MQPAKATMRPIERPIAAFIFSLIGGLLVTAGGAYGLLLTGISYYYVGSGPNLFAVLAVIGLVSGFGVLAGAALLYALPRRKVAWGVMLLVLG